MANNSIHTMAERIAKYELQLAAERDPDTGRVGAGSRVKGRGAYSSQGVLSDEEMNDNE